MYTIYNENRLLFDPRIEGYGITNPVLTLEAHKFGSLSFTIHPNHPEYGHISKLSSLISVYKDDVLFFQCRPAWSRRGIRNSIQYKCEDIIARLNDFQMRPFDFAGTVTEFVDEVLDSYNERADEDKKILRGNVTVTDTTDYVHYSSIDYLPHWEVLQTRLVDTHGGYFIPRYSGGNIYLDYLRDEDLPQASQEIRFGENLTDLFIETDANDTYSVLVPVGANYDTFDEHGDPVVKRLTIESVNDGVDYIENAAAIELYGRRETSRRWEDVIVPANLLRKGQEWLSKNAVKFAETVDISAVDLHNANSNIETFGWLQWITAVSTVHGISESYVSERISIPLGNPADSQLRLGATRLTLTERIVSTVSSATQKAITDTATKARDETLIDLEAIRNTITEVEDSLIATIGATETSILLQVLESYVGKSEFAEYSRETSTSIIQTQNSVTTTASALEAYVDNSTGELRQFINGVQTYMRYSTSGLELGRLGSNFVTRITNERISFLQDNQEIAYISNKKLYITEAQVTNRLLFGNGDTNLFAWVTTDSGMGLKWVGAN